jgi:glutamate racemase
MEVDLPIGVFDSGVGGLTVFAQVRKLLPAEDIIYFGDTKRVPYGPRPHAVIQQFTREILDFMSHNRVKLAIAACNTITVNLNRLPQEYSFPIVGMSKGARTALALTKNKCIGVLATDATIESGKHAAEIQALDDKVKIYPQACHKFASLVEAEQFSGEAIESAAKEYLIPLREAGVDTVILACTHYPFLIPLIRRVLGPQVKLLNPAKETARTAQLILTQRGLLQNKRLGYSRLCFSADVERAKRIASHLLDVTTYEFTEINLK